MIHHISTGNSIIIIYPSKLIYNISSWTISFISSKSMYNNLLSILNGFIDYISMVYKPNLLNWYYRNISFTYSSFNW